MTSNLYHGGRTTVGANRIGALFFALILVTSAHGDGPPPQPAAGASFVKIQLSHDFFCEGANAGDFNHDGKMDVVAGPYWYEGPDFKVRHEIYPAKPFNPHGYSDNFFAFVDDFKHDGWDDVLVVGFPGEAAYWFENPRGANKPWARHLVARSVGGESPAYVDLKGDGKRELVFIADARIGYAQPDAKDPTAPWIFHPISAKGTWQRFTHGMGVGDINGDGRPDIIVHNGWFEQPGSLAGDPLWRFHPVNFGDGGAQMYVYDVNGDGKADVITSLQAHGYGLAWFEQLAGGHGRIRFRQHLIMGSKPEQNAQGVVFSEPHALELVDMNGDGLKDIVTGKRWWAHGPKGDVDANGPAVLYWFELKRHPGGANGGAEFIAHQIDSDSGVGTQVVARDLNGDGKPAVIVGNKKGTFVFLQK